MSEKVFKLLCPSCGAINRVRLPRGRRVRVRCGRCGEYLRVNRRYLFLRSLGRGIGHFLRVRLPEILIMAADLFISLARLFLMPLRAAWRRLPEGARRKTAWAAFLLLAVAYMISEGAMQLTAMLVLLAILLLAMLGAVFALRGPAAFSQIIHAWKGMLFNTCPNCGHRYLGRLGSCPQCGEPQGRNPA